MNYIDPNGEIVMFAPFVWEGLVVLGAALGITVAVNGPPPPINFAAHHGSDPEGATGSGVGYQKHTVRRAGKQYGNKKNENKGKKNTKYKKPKNPNEPKK